MRQLFATMHSVEIVTWLELLGLMLIVIAAWNRESLGVENYCSIQGI